MDIDLDDPEAHTKIDIGNILNVLEGEFETPGNKVRSKKEPKFMTMQTQTSKQDSTRSSRILTARKQRCTMTFPTSCTLKRRKINQQVQTNLQLLSKKKKYRTRGPLV
eukprot:TRINITY_DN2994_c1_g1_i2.p1 TRINITY_DN2994_c1_g1~~TRINITY_DN2994_c1_g1_i2.p1  ORF type:complete len:108 (-),score=16.54 TRINITY_DN2994_c1_g1_i2:13-336(-)